MTNEPRYLEYTSAAVPIIDKLKPRILSPTDNDITCLSNKYTSPNLNACYININEYYNQDLTMTTSNVFFVIVGRGETTINSLTDKFNYAYPENNIISWEKGDIFTIPYVDGNVTHKNLSFL